MASPRLETFCCPNRDAATEFVVSFQPALFGALSLGSAALSLLFAVLQLLPKRKGYRRLGQYPLRRPGSSSRILLIISICDMLGCAGKQRTRTCNPCCSAFLTNIERNFCASMKRASKSIRHELLRPFTSLKVFKSDFIFHSTEWGSSCRCECSFTAVVAPPVAHAVTLFFASALAEGR